jgi:hypothetical protein
MSVLSHLSAAVANWPSHAGASLLFSVTMAAGYPDCQPVPGTGRGKFERSFKA